MIDRKSDQKRSADGGTAFFICQIFLVASIAVNAWGTMVGHVSMLTGGFDERIVTAVVATMMLVYSFSYRRCGFIFTVFVLTLVALYSRQVWLLLSAISRTEELGAVLDPSVLILATIAVYAVFGMAIIKVAVGTISAANSG